MTITNCENCIGHCNRHNIDKTPHWVQLCQTNKDYFNAWENSTGPGQSPKQEEPVTVPIECPHRQSNICNIASEIAGTPCPTSEDTCNACSNSPRPQRLNRYTLTLAVRENSNIDISHINAVIDGTSSGFGTRLSNTLGMIIKPKSGCGCAGHKDILDVWTEDYIRNNLEKVIDWLQTEATNRRLPFSRILTRLLLKSLLSKDE